MKKKLLLRFGILILFAACCIIGGFKLGLDKGKTIGYQQGNKQASDECAIFCTSVCCSSIHDIFGYEDECPIRVEEKEVNKTEGITL